MAHCHFSVRSAPDEMRHIVGISEPDDVIIWSDKDQNRGCKKEKKDHTEFPCDLYERADVGSELENEVRGEDRGHAGDANSIGVRVGCVR